MDDMIFTPREVINMIGYLSQRGELTNPCVCTKIPYKGYEISISMDSSHGPGDLHRTDIRVYMLSNDNNGADVTAQFVEEGQCMIYGYGADLYRIFKMIDERTLDVEMAEVAPTLMIEGAGK